jgi:hypothetical protein
VSFVNTRAQLLKPLLLMEDAMREFCEHPSAKAETLAAHGGYNV